MSVVDRRAQLATGNPRRSVLGAALCTCLCAVLCGVLGAGCIGESIYDDISTELTVTTPGAPGQTLEIRKRFRFSHDPNEARGVYFREARLQILSPVDGNLAFVHRVEVYAVHPEGEPVLVAVGEGYGPDDRVAPLEIVYEEDLRTFAGDDSRVAFSFILEPSGWGRPFPEGGFTVLAAASIEIDI